MVQIRRAIYDDIPGIMTFIDEYWKKNHILARDRIFFEWQFIVDDILDFFIAVDDEDASIVGVNGVIRYNKLDHTDITCCLWKVIPKKSPMLGLEFGPAVYNDMEPAHAVGLGLNARSRKVEKLYGGRVEKLKRYYRLGFFDEFKIAVVNDVNRKKCLPDKAYFKEISRIDDFANIIDEKILSDVVPHKDYWYINHRYFEHPTYKYKLLQLFCDDNPLTSVFVTREIMCGDRKVLKIVDYYGDDKYIQYSGTAFDMLLKQDCYEYVDFYFYGLEEKYLELAGFFELDDNNIIPNYFEPFEQKNVDIYVSLCYEDMDKIRLFRADGDQDRPS